MPATKQLKIAVRKFAPFESALHKCWEDYCRQTGCEIQLAAEPMDLHPLHDRLLKKEGLKKGDWDIAHLSTDWVTEAHADGALENLRPYICEDRPDDYPEGWPDSLLSMQAFDKEIVGLPFHDGPECLVYRKDLFENTKEQQAFKKQYDRELKVPKTWQEFQDVAEFFQRPEEKCYGAVFAAYPDGHNAVFDFCLQLWTRGGELMDDEGYININIPAAIEGLSFYRSMLQEGKAVHPGSLDFDSVKAGMAFANGEAAMMINWFGFASFCEVAEDSKVKERTAITDIPHGPYGQSVSLNSYWMYAIGKGSRFKALAYDFIKFAINRRNDKLLTLEGGIGCRLSTWKDEEVNKIVPYYHKLEALHRHAKGLPCIAEWPEIAKVIDRVMTQTIKTTTPVSQILAKEQAFINQTLNQS